MGFAYRIDRHCKDGLISWRCSTSSKCKGRVKTDSDMTCVVPVNDEHFHPSNDKRNETQQLRTSVKRKAEEDITAKPAKIIRGALHTFDDKYVEKQDLNNMRKAANRVRRKLYPTLPKTSLEVQFSLLSMDPLITKRGEFFIMDNDFTNGTIIFSCVTNLDFLCNKAEEIFIDGTFKCCAIYFYQLYTIHGLKNGHFIPLVYVLPIMVGVGYTGGENANFIH